MSDTYKWPTISQSKNSAPSKHRHVGRLAVLLIIFNVILYVTAMMAYLRIGGL
ncbi:MAG: hypothetical protein ACREGF_04800 [Candidatus Saccharimonadales bacterium]